MSHDALDKSMNAPSAATRPIQIATGEPPHVDKWPLAWRYLLIIGGTLALWAAAIFIGRWL